MAKNGVSEGNKNFELSSGVSPELPSGSEGNVFFVRLIIFRHEAYITF